MRPGRPRSQGGPPMVGADLSARPPGRGRAWPAQSCPVQTAQLPNVHATMDCGRTFFRPPAGAQAPHGIFVVGIGHCDHVGWDVCRVGQAMDLAAQPEADADLKAVALIRGGGAEDGRPCFSGWSGFYRKFLTLLYRKFLTLLRHRTYKTHRPYSAAGHHSSFIPLPPSHFTLPPSHFTLPPSHFPLHCRRRSAETDIVNTQS